MYKQGQRSWKKELKDKMDEEQFKLQTLTSETELTYTHYCNGTAFGYVTNTKNKT